MVARDHSWSTVAETLRRERAISDLIRRSHRARLQGRVMSTDPIAWERSEDQIAGLEAEIRRLDPLAADFWVRYRTLEDRLRAPFRDAGLALDH